MVRYKAVIFDMDGTLLDTLCDLRDALNFSLAACGYPEHTLDEVRSYIGAGLSRLIELALPADIRQAAEASGDRREIEGAISAVTDRFAEYYIVHGEDNTAPYEGIMRLLEGLREHGVATAVVSNKIELAVEKLVESKFGGLIDVAIGDREGVRLKPAPDMILDALSRLKVRADEAVFVGDGDTDIIAAKNAGVPCISVSYGYKTEEFLKANGAAAVAHGVSELAAMLGL